MVSDDESDASPAAGRAAASESAGAQPAPFRPHLDGDEPVRATVQCPAGYDCPDGPTASVADPVVLGVTDRRVLVVPGEDQTAEARSDIEGGEAGAAEAATAEHVAAEEGAPAATAEDAGATTNRAPAWESGGERDTLSLPFTALGAVSLTQGREPVLELVSADKVTYRFPLPPAVGSHGAAVADLRWLGEVRGRVLATSQEVLAAADRIETQAAAETVRPALETYDRARAVLDRLLDTIHATLPLSMAVLAPDLTEVERTLEAAVTRAYVARSRGHLDDAAAAVDDRDFDAARTALEAAREDRDAAERHASEVFRREEFRFGLERDLEEELRELGWEIEAVAADPIRRAQEAVVEAQARDDPAAAAELYEDALEDFRGLLPLGWREGARQFDGEPTAVRADLARTGERLLACYRTLAEREREAMADRAADDDVDGARAACERAASHLERSRELAVEFAPDAVDEVDEAMADLRAEAEALNAPGDASAAGTDASRSADPEAGSETRDGATAADHETGSDGTTTAARDDDPDTAAEGEEIVWNPDRSGGDEEE